MVIRYHTVKSSFSLSCVCFVGRSWQSMSERYRKVLIHKLEEYLPSDVVTQMLEADVGGKPPPFS